MPYDWTSAIKFPSRAATVPASQGLPINQIRFPPSPSPIQASALGSSAPIYMTTSPQPHLLQGPNTQAVVGHGGLPASGILY